MKQMKAEANEWLLPHLLCPILQGWAFIKPRNKALPYC